MHKTTTQIFSEKVSLVYEYNKRTPLFVRMANIEIEKNNVDKAIDIINNGIIIYPFYSTAYIMLGKALTLIGKYRLALKNFKKGSDLINSPSTYEYYVKEMENIKKQRSLFDSAKSSAFIPSDDESGTDQQDLFIDKEIKKDKSTYKKDDLSEDKSVDDRIDELAREISSAKIKREEDFSISEMKEEESPEEDLLKDHVIVSDTLAKIYAAQGETKEAIEIYKKLISNNPDKKDYYEKQIKKLEAKL